MDINDWTRHKDFDDLSRDLTAGDFKNSLLEMRFNAEMSAKQKDGQGVTPPTAV